MAKSALEPYEPSLLVDPVSLQKGLYTPINITFLQRRNLRSKIYETAALRRHLGESFM